MNMESSLFIPTFICFVILGAVYFQKWTGTHSCLSGPVGGVIGGIAAFGIWYLATIYRDYSLRTGSNDIDQGS